MQMMTTAGHYTCNRTQGPPLGQAFVPGEIGELECMCRELVVDFLDRIGAELSPTAQDKNFAGYSRYDRDRRGRSRRRRRCRRGTNWLSERFVFFRQLVEHPDKSADAQSYQAELEDPRQVVGVVWIPVNICHREHERMERPHDVGGWKNERIMALVKGARDHVFTIVKYRVKQLSA